MYALDNRSGVAVMPPVKAQFKAHNEPQWFTEGGNGVSPSYPGADWFNIVQAELLNIITEARITPNKTQLNQLSLAIKAIVNQSRLGLTSDSGNGSSSIAFSAEGAKRLAQLIAQNQQSIAGLTSSKLDKTALNNATNSTSTTTAASSLAVKTAYDKGTEAHNKATEALNKANQVDGNTLKKEGNQIVNGALRAKNTNGWAAYEFETNQGHWRLEAHPDSHNEADRRFNMLFCNNNGERNYLEFPAIGSGKTVAYQDWVQGLVNGRATSSHHHNTGDINGLDAHIDGRIKSVIRRDYSKTIAGNSNWDSGTTRSMQVVGQTIVYPDGKVEQFLHIKGVRIIWFNREDAINGKKADAFEIPIQLWTAMPHKILDVHAQLSRPVANNVTAQDEPLEWLSPIWNLHKQGSNKDKVYLNFRRWFGETDEPIDLYIKVEGY